MRDMPTITGNSLQDEAAALEWAIAWIDRLDRILETRLRQSPRFRNLQDESAMFEAHCTVVKARSMMIARIERKIKLLRDANELQKIDTARHEEFVATWQG